MTTIEYDIVELLIREYYDDHQEKTTDIDELSGYLCEHIGVKSLSPATVESIKAAVEFLKQYQCNSGIGALIENELTKPIGFAKKSKRAFQVIKERVERVLQEQDEVGSAQKQWTNKSKDKPRFSEPTRKRHIYHERNPIEKADETGSDESVSDGKPVRRRKVASHRDIWLSNKRKNITKHDQEAIRQMVRANETAGMKQLRKLTSAVNKSQSLFRGLYAISSCEEREQELARRLNDNGFIWEETYPSDKEISEYHKQYILEKKGVDKLIFDYEEELGERSSRIKARKAMENQEAEE